jgi:hypothetical protein
VNDRVNPLAQAYELAERMDLSSPKDQDFNQSVVDPRSPYVEAYVLYRNRVRIGKRRSAAALLGLLKHAIATVPVKAP